MEQIALIAGPVFVYWSSILRTLACAAAACAFLALYLKKGKPLAAAVFLPLAAVFSLVLARLAHWYFRPDGYENLRSALSVFSHGDFALMGVFAGCFLAALTVRLLRLTDNLPRLLDCLCIAGCLGIAVGRLAAFFNTSGRGMPVMKNPGLPWVCTVLNPVSGMEEFRLATFMLQAMAAGILFVFLLVFYETEGKKTSGKEGDTTLIFLLLYGASQVVLDSTRYDSLSFRSNGFVSVVQVLGALAIAVPVIVFAGRLVYAEGWRIRQLALWLPQMACFALAGYMEYHVQRHSNQVLMAYSVMAGALLVLILLTLLTRSLAWTAEKKRKQQILQTFV